MCDELCTGAWGVQTVYWLTCNWRVISCTRDEIEFSTSARMMSLARRKSWWDPAADGFKEPGWSISISPCPPWSHAPQCGEIGTLAAIAGSCEPLLCASCDARLSLRCAFLETVKTIYWVKFCLMSLTDSSSPGPLLLVKRSKCCPVTKI